MNLNDYDNKVRAVNLQRKKYIYGPTYYKDMLDINLQNFNFKQNDIASSYGANAHTEIMSIFCQMIDLYPEAFNHKGGELIESITNSIYAYADTELFKEQLTRLKNNDDNSFLIIPTNLYGYHGDSVNGGHIITTEISKQSDSYRVTTYDKVGIASYHIEPEKKLLKPKTPKGYVIADYSYHLKVTNDNTKLLVYCLSQKNRRIFNQESVDNGVSNSNFKKIEEAARDDGYGKIKAKKQKVGNCFTKELVSGLKFATFPQSDIDDFKFKKVENKHLSTKKCNITMAYLTECQLHSLGYSNEQLKLFDLYSADYTALKTINSNESSVNSDPICEETLNRAKADKKHLEKVLNKAFDPKVTSFPKMPLKIDHKFHIHYGMKLKLSIWDRIKQRNRIFFNGKKDILKQNSMDDKKAVREAIETLVTRPTEFKSVVTVKKIAINKAAIIRGQNIKNYSYRNEPQRL